jgi:hypothetical protein
MEEFGSFDAMAPAELVRKKNVKPIELVDAAIERMHKNKIWRRKRYGRYSPAILSSVSLHSSLSLSSFLT